MKTSSCSLTGASGRSSATSRARTRTLRRIPRLSVTRGACSDMRLDDAIATEVAVLRELRHPPAGVAEASEANGHLTRDKFAINRLPAPPALFLEKLDDFPSAATCAPLCRDRSEEHTSELQSLMRISYAGF